MLRRAVLILSLAACSLPVTAGSAAAQSSEPVGPYFGEIPFNCVLQNVGTGTDFPDPDADPFCVEFDKTNQNITDFGLVEFTAQEPARVAAASSKCFYFQRDHWTGSVNQGEQPEVWHWDGDYWFDRARGVGGVSVRNFRVGGEPADATPFVPEGYRPYFDQAGGGGAVVEMESGPDPSCAARVDTPAKRDQIYAGRPAGPSCIAPGGKLRGKRIGRVRLGMRREQALARLGPPQDHRRGVDRWCLVGKGKLRVEYADEAGRATLIRSSGRGHAVRGVARGDRARRAHRKLDPERRFQLRHTRVFTAGTAGRRVSLLGIAGTRVRWVAVADGALLQSDRLLKAALRRSR